MPEHVVETGDGDLENISYVGEGDVFSVFAARDSSDHWGVLQYNEPPDNHGRRLRERTGLWSNSVTIAYACRTVAA